MNISFALESDFEFDLSADAPGSTHTRQRARSIWKFLAQSIIKPIKERAKRFFILTHTRPVREINTRYLLRRNGLCLFSFGLLLIFFHRWLKARGTYWHRIAHQRHQIRVNFPMAVKKGIRSCGGSMPARLWTIRCFLFEFARSLFFRVGKKFLLRFLWAYFTCSILKQYKIDQTKYMRHLNHSSW